MTKDIYVNINQEDDQGQTLGCIQKGGNKFTNLKNFKTVTLNGAVFYKDKVYFIANEETHGWSLWESDGTVSGTKLLVDFVSTNERIKESLFEGGVQIAGIEDNKIFLVGANIPINYGQTYEPGEWLVNIKNTDNVVPKKTNDRYFMTVVARESFKHGENGNALMPGHTFIQWITLTSNQTKSEVYGFYAKDDKDDYKALFGQVPGSIFDEYMKESFDKNWTATFRFEMSELDYKRSIAALDKWKVQAKQGEVSYSYVSSNCVLFAATILRSLQDAKLILPSETARTRPRVFVETVKKANVGKDVEIENMYTK